MNLKRLWDTENKKIVRAVNKDTNKEYQVWTNDDGSKLYIYDIEWKELSASLDVCEYWPVWKELEDETVGYYLTNKPTDLYSWDEWDEVAYRFMNWTTVLDSWKVDEGETPEYTGDTPTKSATAQYTYTFSWWKPTVWPISKKTDFKAIALKPVPLQLKNLRLTKSHFYNFLISKPHQSQIIRHPVQQTPVLRMYHLPIGVNQRYDWFYRFRT